jgi:hypothetical protein
LRGRQQLALIVGADALEELGGAPALHSPRELAALGGRLILEHTLHGDDDIRTGLLFALAEGVRRMRGQAPVRGDYDGLAEQLHAFLETEFKEEFAVSHAARELARLGMPTRPEPAGERSKGVDPDAGASQRWDRDIGAAADRTVELVDAWLSCIAAQHGLDLGAALVEIATARLQYYRREAPASPGAAVVYVDLDDAPAPGYIATLHASTGLRRFFLCVQDGSVLPMVTAGTDGTVAYDVAANDVSVSGRAAHEGCAHGNTASGDATDDSAEHDEIGNWLQRHAHIIFGPQDNERRAGEHARVVLDPIAQGPRNELAQWLAPVLRRRFDKAPGAARGQAQAALRIDAPPHLIPFRRALVAMQHNGIDTALASGGVDVTAFAIPMLCSALCVAAEAGRATGPLARLSGRVTAVDVGPAESAAAAGPADLRTGIRAVLQAALKAVNTTATACVPLPLDVDAVAEALRPRHPQLAFALQQAARRESGPRVADGRRRVIGPPGVRPDTVTHRIGDHNTTGLWRQADLPGSSGGSSRGGGTSGLSGLRYQGATQSTFHDLLASRIRGNASPGQIQSFRQRLSADLSLNGGLRELPILPPTLTSPGAEGFALETLPESLPGLERLHVPDNRIRQVPRHLPSTLRDLRSAHNPIDSLLQDDLDRLARGEISLENNPIRFRHLSSWTEGGRAPRIHFSMPGGGLPAASVSSTLAQAVAHWLGQDSAAAANWANIGETLEGVSGDAHAAQAFRLFLDRLRATVSFKNADFRAGVREWLVELSRPERKSLRESSMQVCIGATERCEDYVARVLNDLKAARLHDDIRLGRYDERVGEALDAMRQTFRRACLQDIAYRKIKSLRAVDDVEVYLAYEVKLREQLGLSTVVPEMRFFNMSSVGPEDLKAALEEVREAERTGFYKYLVLDDTWHTLLKRKLGARYREAESRLEGLVNGGSLQERVRAELRKRGQNPDSPQARLYNDPKLEREVWDEMRYDVLEPLTRDLLANAGVPLSGAGVAGPSVGSH